MKKLRPLLCIALSVLALSAVARPGCRIIVNGTALPGIYDPETALRCSQAAIAAAEEITRQAEDAPFSVVPVLCLRCNEADEEHLWGLLLEAYDGVEKLYTVSLGEEYIGTVSDLRQLYQIKNTYLPVWSPENKLTIREVYTYPEAETNAEAIHSAFHRLATPKLPV